MFPPAQTLVHLPGVGSPRALEKPIAAGYMKATTSSGRKCSVWAEARAELSASTPSAPQMFTMRC